MLHDAFRALAADPNLGRAADDVRKGYFRQHVGSHMVYFRRKKTGVEIVRILHEKMSPRRHLVLRVERRHVEVAGGRSRAPPPLRRGRSGRSRVKTSGRPRGGWRRRVVGSAAKNAGRGDEWYLPGTRVVLNHRDPIRGEPIPLERVVLKPS